MPISRNKRGQTVTRDGEDSQDGALAAADTRDILDFIRDMTVELRDLADGRNLMMLSYLLDMAYQEAREASREG